MDAAKKGSSDLLQQKDEEINALKNEIKRKDEERRRDQESQNLFDRIEVGAG